MSAGAAHPSADPALFQATRGGEDARATGILPCQALAELVRNHEIIALAEILPDQIQPASLDLRLGTVAYRVPASFLPGPDKTVMGKIRELGMYPVDISNGAVLERGSVYIVPLLESVALGTRMTAFANPKSSTGRLDIFTRLIVDGGTTSIASKAAIAAHSMPRSRRAPSPSSCARARASTSCACGAVRPRPARRRSSACTRARPWCMAAAPRSATTISA